MSVTGIGTILYVKNYEACIRFYQEILDLPILFKQQGLTCFDFFGNHLIVEIDNRSTYQGLDPNQPKVYSCIRINVTDVKTYADRLKSHNIPVDYQDNPWGSIAKFKDPDGNLLAFRDAASFQKQIDVYKNEE